MTEYETFKAQAEEEARQEEELVAAILRGMEADKTQLEIALELGMYQAQISAILKRNKIKWNRPSMKDGKWQKAPANCAEYGKRSGEARRKSREAVAILPTPAYKLPYAPYKPIPEIQELKDLLRL